MDKISDSGSEDGSSILLEGSFLVFFFVHRFAQINTDK